MGVKVIDRAAQAEVEVDPEQLQEDIESGEGRLAIPARSGTVKLIREGNRTGEVAPENVEAALAEGWSIADDETVAAATMRREESDFASQMLGGAESVATGLSLGLYSSAAEALGASPERMAARRDALGSAATVGEIAGAALPALFSGGASLAGTGAAAARGGIRGALRATPAGMLEAGAARLEGAAGRALAGSSPLVRTVVPMAGRGAAEGFVSGVGAQLHEDVLGDRKIAVDRLLGAGGMGLIFGGATGAIIPGVSAAALAGARLPVSAASKVLNRASGVMDDLASGQGHILERALADGNAKQISKILGVPEESVAPLLPSLRAAAKGDTELDDLLQAGGSQRFEEDLATAARAPVEDVVESVGMLRQVIGRRNKAKTTAGKIDPEKVEVAAVRGQEDITAFRRAIDTAIAEGGDVYDRGVLQQMQKLAARAEREMAGAVPTPSSRAMPAPKGDPMQIAVTARNSLDALKQDADEIIAKVRTAQQRSGSTTAANTLDLLIGKSDDQIGALTQIRRNLEDEGIWGKLGTAQKEVNSGVSAAIAARRDLADGATKRLLDGRRGFTDNRDLLSLVRSGGRFRGEQITENFRDVVRKEIEAAERVAKHYDLDPEQLAVLQRARDAEKKLDDMFAAQRGKVEKLDAVEMWRNAEGNRSVSIGSASSVGSELIERGAVAAGTGIGAAIGGPAGALIGAAAGRAIGGVAGLVKRPYTLLRKYTAIMRHINSSEKSSTQAIAGFVKKMGSGAKKAAEAAAPIAAGAGRAARAGAARGAGMSASDRRKRNDDALKRAQMFAANPDLLADEMRSATINVEDVAPSLSGEMLASSARAAAFLVSKAPVKWSDPLGRTELVDRHSQAKFDRYAETVLDPMSALLRLEDGTLSLEHTEALREVYPSMFADIQRRVLEAIMENPSIGFRARVQAGALLDSPMDAMTRPEMVNTTQAALAAPAQPDSSQVDQPRVNAGAAGSLKMGQSLMTGAGRIEAQQI
jgi:hypothetical protein